MCDCDCELSKYDKWAEIRKQHGENIASDIRAELVCCDIYARVNDTHELKFTAFLRNHSVHDLCYWGEAAARIAEQQGY